MELENRKAELLAPAGSIESLKAAVNAGADAVYIGGTHFGARAYADNLSQESLLAAIDYCHIHQCKLYLAVNTLLKDHEMTKLYDYLLPYYERGVDAVIVQDIGVLSYLHKVFPELALHASTQMTICGLEGAKFLESLGVSRVVMARELSLKEIHEICKEVSLEVETFVHGALCYCYSGQCLYSSMIGGRSGNRGRCAQSCRLPYETKNHSGFLLSPKDISTLEILPDIVEAGVSSLKIEGRMKRPEYTAGVVRIYRKYLDNYLQNGKKNYCVFDEDKRELMALYNRGGFTNGYYLQQNGKNMMSIKRANHFGTEAAKALSTEKGGIHLLALEDLHKGDLLENTTLTKDVKKGSKAQIRFSSADTKNIFKGSMIHRTKDERLISFLNKEYVQKEKQEKIKGECFILQDKPVLLKVYMEDFQVSVCGEIPLKALNQPLQEDRIKKQMEKTGNTPFMFERFDIYMDDNLFLPMQSMNELRRMALAKLERKILDCGRRERKKDDCIQADHQEKEWKKHEICVSVETREQMEAVCEIEEVSRVYLDSECPGIPLEKNAVEEIVGRCHNSGKACWYIMPYIYRMGSRNIYHRKLEVLELFDGVLFKNYEEYGFLKENNYTKGVLPDYNVYTWNQSAKNFWAEQGVFENTAPLELNSRELQARGCRNSEVIVYGHIPMMISAQCMVKTLNKCTKKSEILYMKDRKGKEFPIRNHCDFCYNIIYNHVPLSLLDQVKEMERLQPKRLRLIFTTESSQRTAEIVHAFVKAFIQHTHTNYQFADFTRGHFKRGVE